MTRTIVVPELGEDISEGTIVSVLAVTGDAIKAGQILVEVETDKVVVEIPATRGGTITGLYLGVGDTVRAGDRIAELAPDDPTSMASPSEPENPVAVPASTAAGHEPHAEIRADERTTRSKRSPAVAHGTRRDAASIPAGPSARRLAREIGVPIAQVAGSGARGRITEADVKAHARRRAGQPPQTRSASFRPPPDPGRFGPVTRQPLSGIARATAVNMNHSWARIPHAWLQEKIDITELEQSRQRYKDQVKNAGGSLTLTVWLTHALASCLRQFPSFNAVYDDEREELVLRDYVDIGIAIDTDAGLVVPRVRAADQKGLTEIAQDLSALSAQARARKLDRSDLEGAGFTLSNLGGIGLTGILPLVNWPQVAILGVAASEWTARPWGESSVSRLMMPVTLGFDHRVINGAAGARFLQRLKQLLEEPFRLLL